MLSFLQSARYCRLMCHLFLEAIFRQRFLCSWSQALYLSMCNMTLRLREESFSMKMPGWKTHFKYFKSQLDNMTWLGDFWVGSWFEEFWKFQADAPWLWWLGQLLRFLSKSQLETLRLLLLWSSWSSSNLPHFTLFSIFKKKRFAILLFFLIRRTVSFRFWWDGRHLPKRSSSRC